MSRVRALAAGGWVGVAALMVALVESALALALSTTPAVAAPGAEPLAATAALAQLQTELQAVVPAETWATFQTTQRSWEGYARADCDWKRSLSDGGSVGASLYGRCMTAKARVRINELKLLLCEGYGLTGACEASARYDLPSNATLR